MCSAEGEWAKEDPGESALYDCETLANQVKIFIFIMPNGEATGVHSFQLITDFVIFMFHKSLIAKPNQ